MNHSFRLLSLSCVLALIAGLSACSGGGAEPPKAGAPEGKKVDLATAGSLTGSVKFTGPVPAPADIRLSKDCVANAGPNPQSDAVLVSGDGGLKNAFVYVKDGLDKSYTFDTPTTPVELAQTGCIYTPRVLGVQVGQAIDVVNNDDTLHNVHAMPMVNQEYNKSQPKQYSHMLHTFTAPEVMVRFMCNVHQWMASYVGVVAHPYFAVSDAGGAFTIRDLPPGTYTIEAWHEKFGRQTTQITVGDKQAQTVAFVFTADAKNK
jgi:plastocyanin